MNKVVYNTSWGMFSISITAMRWLAENGCEETKTKALNMLKKVPDDGYTYYSPDFERHDPDLVRCVETLGRKANGMNASLVVKELKGNRYRIDEYDGNEEVYEPEDEEYIIIK